nr:glycosyltransferase [Mesorhizobium sp.]
MGGAERIVRTMALEAARSGQFDRVDVFVLCWSRTGTLDELEKSGNVALYYTEAATEWRGLPFLVRILMRHRYALVFSSSTHINALCSVMRRLHLLRTARLVSRESTVMFERDFGRSGKVFRAFYWLYGKQDLIVCQTTRMCASLNRHTHGRFHHLLKVIPNPIDFDRIDAGRGLRLPPHIEALPETSLKIVWCGRLSPIKSPVRAIETMRALHDMGRPQTHLFVIGDGPSRESVEAAIDQLNLQAHVTLVGYQLNPAAVMACCDLGLMTSDIEGFPNVILEMLAAGVKGVVTTNCAGDLDTIPGVRISAEKTPAAIAEEIVALSEAAYDAKIPSFLEMRRPSSFLCKIMG